MLQGNVLSSRFGCVFLTSATPDLNEVRLNLAKPTGEIPQRFVKGFRGTATQLGAF